MSCWCVRSRSTRSAALVAILNTTQFMSLPHMSPSRRFVCGNEHRGVCRLTPCWCVADNALHASRAACALAADATGGCLQLWHGHVGDLHQPGETKNLVTLRHHLVSLTLTTFHPWTVTFCGKDLRPQDAERSPVSMLNVDRWLWGVAVPC